MALQLIGLVGIVLLVLLERRRYERLETVKYSASAQERAARQAVRPRSSDVEPWGRA